MAQPRQNPALGDLDGDFGLRFVSGFRGTRRNDDRVIVLGPLGVGALHARLVAARHRHAGPQLVRHPDRRHAAKVLDGVDVAGDPVRALLRAGRLGKGVVRGAEHRDEQLDGDHLAGPGVDDRRAHPRVVDERLLAGRMHLPHREPLPRAPGAIAAAERRIAVAGRVGGQVLDVQQFQRDARAGGAPGGPRPGPAPGRLPPTISAGGGPNNSRSKASSLRASTASHVRARARAAADRRRHGAGAHAQAAGHFPMAALGDPLQSQNLSNLSHGQSFRRHRTPVAPVGQKSDGRPMPSVAHGDHDPWNG